LIRWVVADACAFDVRLRRFRRPQGPGGDPPAGSPEVSSRHRARRTGVRGETYAYWYLRRHGYILVAKNYTRPGMKGEIDMVGYDGSVLAFVEVKTRAADRSVPANPEAAVDSDKRQHLARMARNFLRERHAQDAPYRFDILAIETRSGTRPEIRLHKGAFGAIDPIES
jgi:putative endonuclease